MGRREKKKRGTFPAVPIWASGQGKWVWWQFVMKRADTQESRSPSPEYIPRLCMHHFSAHMWRCLCVCVFMHVVVYNGVTPRSSRAVNEVQRLDVHPSVGTPETWCRFYLCRLPKAMAVKVLQSLQYITCVSSEYMSYRSSVSDLEMDYDTLHILIYRERRK